LIGRYYLAQARQGLLHDLQYRTAAAFSLFGFLLEPVIYLAVWRSVAIARGGAVAGYSLDQLTAYYVVWSLVRAMNLALTPYTWEWRIQSGRLNDLLSRPIHPFHHDFAFFAGQKIVWITLWLPFAVVLWFTFRPSIEVTPLRVGAFAVAIWLAFTIRLARSARLTAAARRAGRRQQGCAQRRSQCQLLQHDKPSVAVRRTCTTTSRNMKATPTAFTPRPIAISGMR